MLETRQLIQGATLAARDLDQMLINGRASIVGRNLMTIDGRTHSEKYVGRLAGKSDDVYRKSVTERAVEFYGASILENPDLLETAKAFWHPLLNYRPDRPVMALPTFWEIDEDLSVICSHLRTAVVMQDKLVARFHIAQAKTKLDEMLRIVEGF